MQANHILLALVCCGTLASCFKEEPLNAECDIEQAYVHTADPTTMFFSANDTLRQVLYTDNAVAFEVRRGTDLTALAPQFRITEGATISPASGSVQDFSAGPVVYTVTSEDGQYKRQYDVSFNIITKTVNDTIKYDFENYSLNDKSQYYSWTDLNADGTAANNWASGNAGFAISRSSAKPDEYPTVPSADGYDGACVVLTTRDTGPFGKLKNMRLAAGNLFIGKFDATNAIKANGAMKATQFGLPTDSKPLKLTGYYTYAPGATFQDAKGNAVSGKTDEAAIYAILYRNTDEQGNSVVLNGNDVQTSSYIVAKAIMPKVDPTDEWTEFSVDFDYLSEIDETILDNRGYNLTVVFSSSTNGASFEGAIGSTLKIDKVRVVCAKTE